MSRMFRPLVHTARSAGARPTAQALCRLGRVVGGFVGLATLSGCLEAASTPDLYSSYVLRADAEIPRLDDDPDAVKKLDANDGLGKTIPLRTGYVAGAEVQYWDFGTLTAATLRPMYVFQRDVADPTSGLSRPSGHPDLIDAIPGDTAYSPLRQLYIVKMKPRYWDDPRYGGAKITSVRALEDAVELGLVTSPQPTQTFMDCVVTPATVQMPAGDGTFVVQQEAYYHGMIVKQFCIGDRLTADGVISITDGNSTFPANAYWVRRENENQPLDEATRMVDLNEDTDMDDSNVVFSAEEGSKTYTGVWHNFDVIVSSSYVFGGAKAESDLFDRSGSLLSSKPPVIDFKDTAAFLNRPLRRTP